MKIVAIRGKNLASLEGEFMIDFTVEPLCSAGIFAITGSTGAGKSTLLDALCLALFDCTPRMNKAKENNVSVMDVADRGIAQNDSRSILRRGTAEGYSEVDFVALTGEVFRSRWTVRRSRGKVSGSLQKVEMTLTNLTSGVEQQGTKTELLSRISELIGLSFEQFNRSVLLAQGDFATFLKARQPDKAEILEKLTGTEIYSRISASIYERTKRAESEYKLLQERIKGIELLTDEQLQQLSAEKEELQVRLSVSKKKEEALSGKLKWLEEEGRLNTGCIQAEESLSGIRKEIEAARPRYELLARIEQAQDIRDVYMEQRNARQADRCRSFPVRAKYRLPSGRMRLYRLPRTCSGKPLRKNWRNLRPICHSKNRNWIKPEHWMCSWWKIESNWRKVRKKRLWHCRLKIICVNPFVRQRRI